MQDLKTLAIEAALRQDWETAVKINITLLRENPHDIETLNRLAFAQMEKGNRRLAKKTYQKILTLDHFNPIAQKNLNKLTSLPRHPQKKNSLPQTAHQYFSVTNVANLFLEEVGKTKVVKLKNLAEAYIISQLTPGDEVTLSPKRRSIFVLDQNQTYLGALPDDLSHRLIQFIKYGNKYQTFVKSVDKNSLTVFIKEMERAPKFRNQPSFISTPLTYLTSVREEVLGNQEKPEVTSLEEAEDEKEEAEEKAGEEETS